jgi:hypothetical protein
MADTPRRPPAEVPDQGPEEHPGESGPLLDPKRTRLKPGRPLRPPQRPAPDDAQSADDPTDPQGR